jgi:DTW domain-containing protein YfiP
MDKETYLKNKNKLIQEVFHKETYCYTCFRMQKNCLCHLMKPFETKIQFIILIHPMEAKKEKLGTGRMTRAILSNSKLIMGIDFSLNEEVNAIIQNKDNSCFVLYPGDDAINVSSGDVATLYNKNIVVFVIDGTWPCAKKMMKLSINLHLLPRVSFTASHKSIFEIKEQPADFCLSTIESIHFFLSECERRGLETLNNAHQNMLDVFKAMISFQLKCASDPTIPSFRTGARGYKKKEERVKSKKWETRKIVHSK